MVDRVEFYNGTVQINSDGAAPYSFDWTTTAVGAHVITAQAYDNDNAVTTSQSVTVNVVPDPNDAPPTVARIHTKARTKMTETIAARTFRLRF